LQVSEAAVKVVKIAQKCLSCHIKRALLRCGGRLPPSYGSCDDVVRKQQDQKVHAYCKKNWLESIRSNAVINRYNVGIIFSKVPPSSRLTLYS